MSARAHTLANNVSIRMSSFSVHHAMQCLVSLPSVLVALFSLSLSPVFVALTGWDGRLRGPFGQYLVFLFITHCNVVHLFRSVSLWSSSVKSSCAIASASKLRRLVAKSTASDLEMLASSSTEAGQLKQAILASVSSRNEGMRSQLSAQMASVRSIRFSFTVHHTQCMACASLPLAFIPPSATR